jgi:hypothetical protein
MKNKNKLIGKLYAVCILALFACSEKQKCGVGKVSNGKVEFYICEEMFNQDTIINSDNRWFAESDFVEMQDWVEYENVPILERPPIVSDSWLGEFDSIAFYLPNGYKIIEAKQSFVIIPSIWAKDGDDVIQYMDFYDLKMYCNDPKVFKLKNNILLNPLEIDEMFADELYFKNSNGINKNQLLSSLKKQFDTRELDIKNRKIDEFFSTSDKKEYLEENQREKEIYTSYLKDYINWGKATKERFRLLAVERYLTLSIQNGEKTNKLTLIYVPIYGN